MDARRVVAFLFLCLSTGYCLKNDDVDDDVLDMLQEMDNLKEALDMVSCDTSHMSSSYFFLDLPLLPSFLVMACFAAFEHNKIHQMSKIVSISQKRSTYTFSEICFSLDMFFFFY